MYSPWVAFCAGRLLTPRDWWPVCSPAACATWRASGDECTWYRDTCFFPAAPAMAADAAVL
eukprot:2541836-Prymnesium_polylepis.1